MRYFLILSFFALVAVNRNVFAINLALDTAKDATNVVDITCVYSDDYADFWAYGCPTNPSEDIYPESSGFWTACNTNCEIIYYGGLLPKPAKLLVRSYIQGDSYIQMSGKTNQDDPKFDFDYGYLNSSEQGWQIQEIDLSNFPNSDAAVINFTLVSSSNGFVLIDKVEIDLGDKPIEPIELDTLADELSTHWSYDDCFFSFDYKDFWVYGCPADTESENPVSGAIGYWTPCSKSSCIIEFATSPSIIPSSLKIKAYISGDAEIQITTPGISSKNNPNPNPRILETIKAVDCMEVVGGWIECDRDLTEYNQFKIDIILISKGNSLILDSLSFEFDPKEIITDSTSEATTITTSSTPTPNGAHVDLDTLKDYTKVLDISCAYNDDYADFWVYGCPTNPLEDIYPESLGFWTACNTNCQIIYYGGLLPKPAKLLVRTYIQGDSYIQMSGKSNPNDPTFDFDYGYLDSSEPGWHIHEIDLSNFPNSDAAVFNFTLGSSSNGFVLIDRVIIDLGDKPIEPIELDTLDDELPIHWTYDNCFFSPDYKDFWVYGCEYPADTEIDNPVTGATGYWTPCRQSSCIIEFATSPSIIPSSIHIRAYLSGDAKLEFTTPDASANNNFTHIATIEAVNILGEWLEYDVDLTDHHQFKIDIKSIVNGGSIILDFASFRFGLNTDPTSDPTGPTDSTSGSTGPTDSTSTTSELPNSTDKNTGVSSVIANFQLYMLLMMLMIFHLN